LLLTVGPNMLKAVVDTSVFISGLIKSPSCRKIINALTSETFILVVSPEILEELSDVLARPKFHGVFHAGTARSLLETIRSQALVVKPAVRLQVVKNDPDDNCFVEAAVTSPADCIVSLDGHLLSLKVFREIPVLRSDEFLALLHK